MVQNSSLADNLTVLYVVDDAGIHCRRFLRSYNPHLFHYQKAEFLHSFSETCEIESMGLKSNTYTYVFFSSMFTQVCQQQV